MRTALIIVGFIILSIVIAFTIRTDVVNVPNLNAKGENKKEKGLSIRQKWDVPDQLKEISALTYLDPERFACIQDEHGKIFVYNVKHKKIEKEFPVAGAGDYEDLAIVENTAYVLHADGKIYEIKGYNSPGPASKVHSTSLTKKHDAEGMCYDARNNRLLVAIKGKEPGIDDYKGIYEFDLSSNTFSKDPVYKIDLNHEVFADVKVKKPADKMQPAAIAIHPKTGDLYITEGAKPKLLIMDPEGNIKSLVKLKEKEFTQPEGISFSPDGQMFISNEGKKEPGNIMEVEEVFN